MKLKLNITQGEKRELYLQADNMNELVSKIIDWQEWQSQPHEIFIEKGTLEKERDSGWYYLHNKKI